MICGYPGSQVAFQSGMRKEGQVPESTEKKTPLKTTVKVTPELLLELSNEQNRLQNMGQRKPSQGELVNRAWRAYKDSSFPVMSGQIQVLDPRTSVNVNSKPETDSGSANLHDLTAELSSSEREFLGECLRIYRSEFGKPLQENVTFFGIGLSAVEALAAIRVTDERGAANASSPGAGEQRASTLLDNAENEAHLLKKAAHDVAEELRRNRGTHTGTSAGTESGRKGSARKAGGRR